jgi:alkylation response protein AidB-like acyl-CoA dehydrogenase
MRFALTDEQQMLRESVRGALTRELSLARVRTCLERRDGGAALRALAAAQGWTGIGIDEDAGGQGGGVVEQVVLAEELGYAAAPTSSIIAGALAARVLAAGGGRAAQLLEELADGAAVIVVASGAGGAGGAATITAGRAHGSVEHVLAAPEADVAIVFDGAGAGHAVDVHAGGCAVRARELVDPGRSIGDLDLDGAPAEALGGGAAGDLAALGAVLVSAEAVGAAARLLELTVEYVGQRQQFGVVIGSFQAIKHAAADMLVEIETARSAVYYAAWALGSGDDAAAAAVSMAKAYAVPAAAAVADKALALHGAVGFTWEHDLHLFLKRTHTARALFGSAAAHRELVAATLDLTGTAARSPAGVT